MNRIETAYAQVRSMTENLPMEPAVRHLSEAFRFLADSRYLIRSAQWLNTFEVAAIAKWVYLDGHGGKPQAINWPDVLNAHKFLWRETENAIHYPDDAGGVASFILRLVYQQLIWNITPEKIQANFARARAIFGGPSAASSTLRSLFERETGVPFEDFLKAAHVLYGVFRNHGCTAEDYKLVEAMQRTLSAEVLSSVLRALSATRGGFRRYYETVAAAETPQGVVYEINPLLRYPILHHRDRYWCVFPELINYASTRGLYFYVADLAGDGFSRLFSDAFEDYVATLCRNAYGLESVPTEADDRTLHWKGKTNEVTILVDNAVLLLECKNSGCSRCPSGRPIRQTCWRIFERISRTRIRGRVCSSYTRRSKPSITTACPRNYRLAFRETAFLSDPSSSRRNLVCQPARGPENSDRYRTGCSRHYEFQLPDLARPGAGASPEACTEGSVGSCAA